MKKKIVVAAKDLAAAGMMIPILKKLEPRGFTFINVIEGQAVKRFSEAGFQISVQGGASPKDVFEFDASAFLEKEKPDAVFVGVSIPINVELAIAKEATAHGIPVIIAEDYWNSVAYRAPSMVPDLMLVVDDYARELARAKFNQAPVVVVGNSTAKEPPQEVLPAVQALSEDFARVIMYGGGGSYTTAELQWCVELLKIMPVTALIVRYHPKWANERDPKSGRPYGVLWDEILKPVGGRVVKLDSVSAEQALRGSDYCVSGFSHLLGSAALGGITPVSLWTPDTAASLLEQAGLKSPAHVELGCAHRITEPQDLTQLPPIPEETVRAKIMPLDSDRAAAAILELWE